ncbi:MAG: pyrroline-5-carboxylate reductase [Actinomycetota bacterium]
MTALQIIGGGKMGQALLGGLLAADWAGPDDLAVVEVLPELRAELVERFPGVDVRSVPLSDIDTMVAVKPHFVVDVCRGLHTPTRVLSVAAGITLAAMEDAVPSGTPVIRVMPNTPALVGVGAAALSGGSSATEADVEWATGILRAVGEVVVVTEAQLDAVTGLSGSGPAYVFLVAEALIDAGVSAGLPAEVATTLATQTLLGAATLLAQGEGTAAEQRAAVTTPAGTTAAGLRVLEQRAVRAAFIDAVQAATDRSRQLGG